MHLPNLLLLVVAFFSQDASAIRPPLVSYRMKSPLTIEGVSRDPESVKFYFVRKWNDSSEITLNETITSQGFQDGSKTFILIDGFDSPRTPFYELLTKAIKGETENQTDSAPKPNVFIVDYRKLSGRDSSLATDGVGSLFLYLSVLKNVDIVGDRVANLIRFLKENANTNPTDIHIVGMSMGCHIAGSAAMILKRQYNITIGRISGLDPARTFYPLRIVTRLRRSTGVADFIDSYHTNRGMLGEIFEGTADVNVFINGGTLQPGCENMDFTLQPYPGICSHLFAWEIFAASFTKPYYACPCSDWGCYCQRNCRDCDESSQQKIGIGISTKTRGNYHLTVTNPTPGEYFKQFRNIFDNPKRM